MDDMWTKKKFLPSSIKLVRKLFWPEGSGESGFTLLEVIIALSIMVLAFSSIIAVESGSINASARAKQMNVVAMLARNQMIETEFKIEKKKFEEVKAEEAGQFEPPFEDYKWKTVIKELKFPSIPTGQNPQGGGPDQITELITKLMTNFLSKAIREVTVTISWKRGKFDQNFSITTYWVNLNHEFSLSE